MWILPFLMYGIQLFQLAFLSSQTEMNLKNTHELDIKALKNTSICLFFQQDNRI